MASKIVVAFPGAVLKRLLWDRSDVVLFDETGWWVIDGPFRQRRAIDTLSFDLTWSEPCDVVRLLAKIKGWSDVWCRWVAHADHFELLYREAIVYILHAQAALRELQAAAVIFCTSIAHHIDSSLLQLACAEARTPQVFLYCNNINLRLQPLVQMESVCDRSASPALVSDYEVADDIKRFITKRLAGERPLFTVPDEGRYRSFAYAAADACYVQARQVAAKIRRRQGVRRNPDAAFLAQFEPLGLGDHLRVMRRQKRGLSYFRRSISTETLERMAGQADGPLLLLAAHYQPEATTFPEGGELHNHIDLVVRIRSLGYRRPIIYKEHRSSTFYTAPVVHQTRVGMHRSQTYYRRLQELGCVFMDPAVNLPLDRPINRRFVPVTMTGTIAIERSLTGLTTLVTGHPWYKGLPGAFTLAAPTVSGDLGLSGEPAYDAIAEESFEFLNGLMSRKTILNVPGIGTGQPIDDAGSIQTFAREFNSLLEQL